MSTVNEDLGMEKQKLKDQVHTHSKLLEADKTELTAVVASTLKLTMRNISGNGLFAKYDENASEHCFGVLYTVRSDFEKSTEARLWIQL